jgi:hypothetical protein
MPVGGRGEMEWGVGRVAVSAIGVEVPAIRICVDEARFYSVAQRSLKRSHSSRRVFGG